MTGRTTRHISESLLPANVELLRSRGVKFEWRQAEHDLVTVCPLCAGRLILDEAESWHSCHGDINCAARGMDFEEIVEALQAEARP